MNKDFIHQKTLEALRHVESLGYRPIYIGLYGSQNYWLDLDEPDYKSDLDWKCLILPTIEDLVKNSKPVSTVIAFEWWQIDLKDIRSFVDSFVKCNVNFLEIFTTEFYYCTNNEILALRKMVPQLMKEMWFLYIKACYWMIKEKEAALRHPYPTTKHRLDKYGYDPKQFHHIARLLLLMKRYEKCESKDFIFNVAWFTHHWDEADALISYKKWDIPNQDIDKIVKEMIEQASEIVSHNRTMTFDAKEQTIQFAHDLIINEIIKWIKEKQS